MIFQKNGYYESKILIVIILVFICTGSVFAAKIIGIVTDGASGEPLPGANIYLEGTGIGSASGLDGSYFILNVPEGKYTVTVS